MAQTITSIPTTCAVCGTTLTGQKYWHGHWQRYCSSACVHQAQIRAKMDPVKAAYALADDAALRRWLVDQLNHRTVTAVAGLCGVSKQAVYHWMRYWGIRKVVRYE